MVKRKNKKTFHEFYPQFNIPTNDGFLNTLYTHLPFNSIFLLFIINSFKSSSSRIKWFSHKAISKNLLII